MTDAAGQANAGRTIYAPRPFPIDEVLRQWSSLRELPEIACTDAWSAACAGWWRDDRDRRLRRRTLDVLVLGDAELATWLARDLDRKKLEDAHRHVTSQRAGLERDVAGRKLVKSALRTTPVLAEHRGGARTI